MTTCALAYPNRVDEAVLSGGSWEASLPLPNLQTRQYTRVARSTDADAASTQFEFALPYPRSIRVAALDYHNCSISAKWRVRLYTDAGHTELVHDTGLQNVFPILYTEETADWDLGEFFDLTISEAEREGFRLVAMHLYDTAVWGRYGIVEIVDEANEDGYVEAGRFFIGGAFLPEVNMSEGAGINYEDRDIVDEVDSGAEYFNPRPAPRVVRFALNSLSETEAMLILDMHRTLGTSGELLFIWDIDDTLHLLRRTFIGRMRKMNPLEAVASLLHRTAFEIKENL